VVHLTRWHRLARKIPPARGSDPDIRFGGHGRDKRGHLVIIDRAKDVGKLSDGTPFAPQFVENKLKFRPFIGDAVAFSDQLPFGRDRSDEPRQLGRAAQPCHSSLQDLSAKPEVRRLIDEEIVRCARCRTHPPLSAIQQGIRR
jgi:long-subunit acyl-CoA synthetase (AMP-forming)